MGGEVAWRGAVQQTYHTWKYNDMHKNVKTYFNEVQHKKFGESFKKESNPLIANLSELKDDVSAKKNEDKNIFMKQEDKTIRFLGENIEVGDEDEEEVEKFCKETIFGGFWKTITKLCNSVYLAVKTVGDVLKKLLKKLLGVLYLTSMVDKLVRIHAIHVSTHFPRLPGSWDEERGDRPRDGRGADRGLGPSLAGVHRTPGNQPN